MIMDKTFDERHSNENEWKREIKCNKNVCVVVKPQTTYLRGHNKKQKLLRERKRKMKKSCQLSGKSLE